MLKDSRICLLDRKYSLILKYISHFLSIEGQENCKVPAFLNMRKRKRVTFGEDLSPEVFDESLPANTPLRKGETPVRKRELSSLSPLLLDQSQVPERLPQPNFDDKGENLVSVQSVEQTCLYFHHTRSCSAWAEVVLWNHEMDWMMCP